MNAGWEEYIHWIRKQLYLGYTPQQIADHLQTSRETIKNTKMGLTYRLILIQEHS